MYSIRDPGKPELTYRLTDRQSLAKQTVAGSRVWTQAWAAGNCLKFASHNKLCTSKHFIEICRNKIGYIIHKEFHLSRNRDLNDFLGRNLKL